jgi:hypothetical protein
MIERIISALKAEQARAAHGALQAPAGRDSFEYGRVCGIYSGLQQALNVIDAVLKDIDRKESEL